MMKSTKRWTRPPHPGGHPQGSPERGPKKSMKTNVAPPPMRAPKLGAKGVQNIVDVVEVENEGDAVEVV